MAKIYLSLIRKGLKTLEDVPEQLREEVRALLEAEEAKAVLEPEQEYPDITVPDELDGGYTIPDEDDIEQYSVDYDNPIDNP